MTKDQVDLDAVRHRGCGGALRYKFARIVHDTFRPGYLVCLRCGARDIRPDEREPRGNVCLSLADA